MVFLTFKRLIAELDRDYRLQKYKEYLDQTRKRSFFIYKDTRKKQKVPHFFRTNVDDNTIIIPLYYHNNTIILPLTMVF